MSDHRRPSMPRIAWLEPAAKAPEPPPPPLPEPVELFRPRSAIRAQMLPPARPVVQAIARVTVDGVSRLVFRLGPPPPRVDIDDDDEDIAPPPPSPIVEGPRDWLSIAAHPAPRGSFGVPVATIIAATAAFYDVAVTDILARRRGVDVVRPRQVAMYLTKVLTTRSYPDIGRRIGGRDHTTILHGVRKITGLLATDAALAADVNALLDALSAAKPDESKTPEAAE
jgi:hypothetical protein